MNTHLEFSSTEHLNFSIKETTVFFTINPLHFLSSVLDHFASLDSLYYSYLLNFYFESFGLKLQFSSVFFLNFQVVTNATYASVFYLNLR